MVTSMKSISYLTDCVICDTTSWNMISTTKTSISSGETKYYTNYAIGLGVGLSGTFVILAVVILLLLLFYRNKRLNFPFANERVNEEEVRTLPEVLVDIPARPFRPVKISELLDLLNKRRADKAIYHEEFKSLPPVNSPRIKSCSDAEKCRSKNRYLDILPYNEDRVRLIDSNNDYINASFIDGYNIERAYIATQGPLNYTCNDLWSMIWEQNSNKIIMVANLIEDGISKCAQYFPLDEISSSMTFESFVISLSSEDLHHDYIIRTFSVTKENETRIVRQYHYTKWPDQGVPDNCTSLIQFYKACFMDDSNNSGPAIIHCSAGVGRTGTLLAIDILLKQANEEGQIDIPLCVDKMRRRRLAMVQTLAQYIFIHFTITEMLLVGDVSIPKSHFKKHFSILEHPLKFDKSTLEFQFELLNASKIVFSEQNYIHGTINSHLNRFSKVLPIDEFKAFLKSDNSEDGKYINAIFVSSHTQKDRFIVTHSPMPTNVENFWELITNYNCSAIIMLNDVPPDEDKYWPRDGESKICGELTITNFGEISSEDVVLSQLKISNLTLAQNEHADSGIINEGADFETLQKDQTSSDLSDQNVLNVRHIRISSWPDGEPLGNRKESLLSMVCEAFKCIERNPQSSLLVHCMNGAERSGIFCALYCILEKLRVKDEVDVFNSVKKIQKTRPEFIYSIEQLRTLYEIADLHLSNSE